MLRLIGTKMCLKYSKISNLNYALINFLASFAGQKVLNKVPSVWLDGARPPPQARLQV
jgi:hypothetical protein